MINIQSELDEFEMQFISIIGLINRTKEYARESNDVLVAKWLLKRTSEFEEQFPELVSIDAHYKLSPLFSEYPIEHDLEVFRDILSDVIKYGALPDYDEVPFENCDWNSPLAYDAGFRVSRLNGIFPFLDEPLARTNVGTELDKDLVDVPVNDQDSKTIDFGGKDTALMLIAGLAVALEKTGERFKRGGKMNKSAVIQAAEQAINSYGKGVNVTDRALRDWLTLALNAHTSKLVD